MVNPLRLTLIRGSGAGLNKEYKSDEVMVYATTNLIQQTGWS